MKPHSPAKRCLFLTGLVLVLLASPCAAQAPVPREEVLRLVPPDTGLCLIVSDLREHTQTLREAVWLKALRASPLGQILAGSPELGRLAKVEEELKQNLHIDLAKLRDDIIGDLVVLAYRPGQPRDEEGLLLLWARKPELLSQFVDRLNEVQTRKKQLKELKSISYRGETYFRRAEADKTHYYLVRGSLLAFSSKEALIRSTIERQQRKSEPAHPLVKQISRARAHQALATLWVNPRAFDAELQAKTKQALGQEAQVLQSFFAYWKALDAIVVSANLADAPEIRLSLQARPGDLPKSVRRVFTDSVTPSDLWTRFPADSILRIAGRLDAEGLTEAISELTPSSDRTTIAQVSQRYLAPLGLDLTKLGPDWGICVTSGSDKSDIPLVLAALAVQPGKLAETLYAGAQGVAAFAVLTYNSSHADAIRLETTVVDKVEVKYLTGDKAFPAGIKPAFAVKDGYFLLASSPEAMGSFKKTAALPMPTGENAIAQLSLSQLSKFIKVRRAKVIAGLAEKNQKSNAVAEQFLDGILTVFDLFDHVLLSERCDAGQLTWSLRLAASN